MSPPRQQTAPPSSETSLKWRIYYADGTIWDDDQGLEECPSYGVICILQQRGYDGRYFMTSQSPYYMRIRSEWLPVWMNDIEDYLANQLADIERLIIGRIIPKSEFMAIYEQAKADRSKMG